MATQIKLRRDTYQNWYDNNPVLGQGEPAYDLTNNKLKIGDGLTAWRLLPYFDDKVTDFSAVATDILPDADNTRDLGSPAKQWRHVYTAGGSIYLDNIKLTNEGGKLAITKVINPGEETEAPDPSDSNAGDTVTSKLANGQHTFELMNDGSLELDGNPYNPGGGGGPGLGDFTIDSDILEADQMTIRTNDGDLIIQSDSDVVVRASGTDKQWQFNTAGDLELPEGGDIVDHLGNSVLGGGGGVTGLTGNTNFTPTNEGDTKYELNINNDIKLKTYLKGTGQGDFGPGFSLGNSIDEDHSSGVIAIGNDDVGYGSKPGGVYIGYQAGFNAGEVPQGEFAIAIGAKAARNFAEDNSITLNATGQDLDPDEAGLFIKPIRAEQYDDQILFYNPNSGEVTYAANTFGVPNLTDDQDITVTVGNTNYFAIVNRTNADGQTGIDATAVAYDSQGNIITLHVSEVDLGGEIGNIDRLIVSKFSTYGEAIWQKQIDQDVDVDTVHDVALDNDDNIIVALSADNGGADDTIVVVKMDSSGTVLWQKDYHGILPVPIITPVDIANSNTIGSGTYNSNPVDIVSLAGTVGGINAGHILQESANGTTWTTIGTAVGSQYDEGNGWTNVYFAQGTVTGPLDYPTKSYRMSVQGVNSHLEVGALVVNGDNIFVAGYYNDDDTNGDDSGYVMKVSNTDGTFAWAYAIDVGANFTRLFGMDQGADGHLVLVGTGESGLGNGAVVIKLNSVTGSVIWTSLFFDYENQAVAYNSGDVVVDSLNNVYVSVNTSQNIVHDNGNNTQVTIAYVTKINSNGARQWTRRIGPGPCASIATGIDCDSSGGVYLSALTVAQKNPNREMDNYNPNDSKNVLAVAKYSPSGTVMWQRYIECDSYWFDASADETGAPLGFYNPTLNRGRNLSLGPDSKLAVQVTVRKKDADDNAWDSTYTESITFQIDQDGREMTVGNGSEKFTVKESRIPGKIITPNYTLVDLEETPLPISDVSSQIAATTATLTFSEGELAQQVARSAPYNYVFGNDGTLTIPNDGDIKLVQTQIGWFSIYGPIKNDYNNVDIRASVVDPSDGSVYAVGESDDSGQGFLTRYSSKGEILWSIRFNDNDEGNNNRANAVKIHPITGNVMVLLEYYGSYDVSMIVEVDPDTVKVVNSFGLRDQGDSGDATAYDFAFTTLGDAVIVGRKYDEYRQQSITPITGSTTDLLVFNASDIQGDAVTNSFYVSGTGITGRWNVVQVNRHAGLTGTTRQGSGAQFQVVSAGDSLAYVSALATVPNKGTNYLVGHKIKILGTDLGGATPANDAIITVTEIGAGGSIEAVTVSGTGGDVGGGTYNNLIGTNYEVGSGAVFTVNKNSSDETNYAGGGWNVTTAGSNYVEGDVITVPGTQLYGTTPANDLTITVASVSTGGVTAVNLSGTAQTAKINVWLNEVGVDFSTPGTWKLENNLGGEAFVWMSGFSKVLSAGSSNDTERYYSVALDADNNIYAAGEMIARNGAAGGDLNSYWCAVITKINNDGTHAWTKALNDNLNDCYAKCVAVNGTTVVVSHNNTGNGTTVITKLDTSGNVKWQRRTTSIDDSSVALDNNGNIYAVIEANFENKFADVIKVIRFNSVGEIVWRKFIGHLTYENNAASMRFKNGRNLTLSANHLHISGYTYAQEDYYRNGVVIKIPASGDTDGFYGNWALQQENYDVDKVNTTEAAVFTPVVTQGNFEPWNPDFSTQWWDPSDDNYYHTLWDIFDRDGGAIEFADGTRQTRSAQMIPQKRIDNGMNHRLTLEDMGGHIYFTNTYNSTTVHVPYHQDNPLPIGYTVVIVNNSGDTINIDADGGGMTIIVPGVDSGQYWDLQNQGMATLLKVDDNVWFLTGNVTLD